jgi:hypothetical protein
MRNSPRSRVVASFLAALFIGGAGGASDLDAFLFHRAGASVGAGISHIETAANAACHGERCVLALRIANGRVASVLRVPVRFEGIPQYDAGTPPEAPPRSLAATVQPQPRAPPASIA